MECPNCQSEKCLDWRLTACEFKCENCGNLVRLCELAESGEIKEDIPTELKE